MQKLEKINRIAHIIFCVLNIGAIFFGIMVLSGGGNHVYGFFRDLSILFAMPMFFMRIGYLQYVFFGIIAVLSVIIYANKIKNKCVTKKWVGIDILLWLCTIIELIYLEKYFLNILWF